MSYDIINLICITIKKIPIQLNGDLYLPKTNYSLVKALACFLASSSVLATLTRIV